MWPLSLFEPYHKSLFVSDILTSDAQQIEAARIANHYFQTFTATWVPRSVMEYLERDKNQATARLRELEKEIERLRQMIVQIQVGTLGQKKPQDR